MKFVIGDIVIIKDDKMKDLWEIEGFHRENPKIVRLIGRTNRSIVDVYEDDLIKADKKTIDEIFLDCNKYFHKFLADIKNEIQNLWEKYSPVQNIQESEKEMEAQPVAGQQNLQKVPQETVASDPGNEKLIFKKPGAVLHMDTDKIFMEKCLNKYKELGIPAVGFSFEANEFPKKVIELLEKEQPDILIITGHDQLMDKSKPFILDSYINSKYFAQTVREARNFDRNKNSLIIFAGACNSFFEALIEAGSNFASSPMRVKIADLDPAVIAISVALTPILTKIDLVKIISYTKAGMSGIGGIETEGTMRNAIPNKKYVPEVSQGAFSGMYTENGATHDNRNIKPVNLQIVYPYYRNDFGMYVSFPNFILIDN